MMTPNCHFSNSLFFVHFFLLFTEVFLKLISTFPAEISTVTDWSKFNCSLHKMHIDNISEYIDRKRQRMEDLNKKKTKKQKMEVEV